jgi:hypothetical protein
MLFDPDMLTLICSTQCSVIAGRVDPERLNAVVASLRLSAKSKKALLASWKVKGSNLQ